MYIAGCRFYHRLDGNPDCVITNLIIESLQARRNVLPFYFYLTFLLGKNNDY